MILKQILYLGNWIVQLNRTTFSSYLIYAQNKSHKSKTAMVLDIVYCVLRYKISIMEYFQFNFFLLEKEARKTYVGTPCLEEYLSKMNPKTARGILDNKLKFLETYSPLFKRMYATMADVQDHNDRNEDEGYICNKGQKRGFQLLTEEAEYEPEGDVTKKTAQHKIKD